MNWLIRLIRRRQLLDDLADEIREHRDERVDALVADGTPRKEAETTARREFGNVTLIEKESRNVWRWVSFENVLKDARYGLRMVRRSPGFSAACALIVALGIGTTTAIFSVVYGVMLRPLPYPEPDRLVALWSRLPDASQRTRLNPADYREFRGNSTAFEDIALANAPQNF